VTAGCFAQPERSSWRGSRNRADFLFFDIVLDKNRRSLTRGRGLKQSADMNINGIAVMSLAHTRAWIETIHNRSRKIGPLVARSHAGVD